MTVTQRSRRWIVEWKSGQGKRWSIGLRGPNAEEVVVRAVSLGQAEAAARALRLAAESPAVMKRAYNALFVHGDCESCCAAAEAVGAVLKELQEPLVTAGSARRKQKRTAAA
jgi:hypothetical protein